MNNTVQRTGVGWLDWVGLNGRSQVKCERSVEEMEYQRFSHRILEVRFVWAVQGLQVGSLERCALW